MLSAIVYGRNDGYSYELNRRTALGLNQLAQQLIVGRDEILFVDYNTDNDLPTHPEAIADTLTDRAKDLIRVIRVRPDIHAALTTPGPPVREAVCRNIALRRLSPATEWVLSTNPDCLLIAADDRPLSTLIEGLAEGFYGLPRFELPRFAWESLPRSDPKTAAATALTMAKALSLEEPVSHYLPEVGYDAPGDFQLIPAAALRDMAGFDEAISQGWHVDSNMNARLAGRYGPLRDLNTVAGGALKLFHAEHARRFSPKHSADRAEDGFDDYVVNAPAMIPPAQADSWGHPDADLEMFPLSDPPAARTLSRLIAAPGDGAQPGGVVYGPDTFNRLPRDAGHLAGFLADHLAYAPPSTRIGWFGEDGDAFAALLRRADLPQPVEVCPDITDSADIDALVRRSDMVFLNSPADDGAGAAHHALASVITDEWRRAATGAPPRRVIGANTPHSLFEAPFLTFIAAAMTPVTTRIRYGEVKPRAWSTLDITRHMTPGDAGRSTDKGIEATGATDGYAALCRLTHFPPGDYELRFEVDLGVNWSGRVVADVALDGVEAASTTLPTRAPGRRSGVLRFTSGADGMFGGGFEFRLFTGDKARARLTSVTLQVAPG